ncbi:MAG: 50S ribosomal protein L11 [Thermoprotei archaeon]|nr:MAG: 50S ribosomal protein L11 [Thermoprotei archaeon]
MPWKIVRVRVPGGKASPSPPLGPTISQYGLDVGDVVNKINELTRDYDGLEVTVEIYVDPVTKEYRIDVRSPTTTSLLLRLAGASAPSGDPANKKVGDLKLEDVIKVAILKKNDLNAKSLKAAVKTILSSAATIGLTVNGKEPREVIKDISSGIFDNVLLKYEDEWKRR